MPSSKAEARRAVVLTLETYQRLCDKATDHSKYSSEIADPDSKAGKALETSVTEQEVPFVQNPIEVLPEEPQQVSQQIAQTDSQPSTEEPILAVTESPNLLEGIPGRFRKGASNILDLLEKLDDIHWDVDSQIFIDRVSQGITIQQFLKATSVPFTKIKLSPACHQFLDRHNIKSRNHLTKVIESPPWHPYFRL